MEQLQATGEPSGTMLALWLPALVAAHLLAFLFLWRVLCMLYPQRFKLRRSPAGSSKTGGSLSTPTPSTVMQHHRVAPVSLQWHDVGCTYIINGVATPVLQGVSGSLAAGQLAVLLGPSGAGKSTFMDMLAGRKTLGQLSGQVLVNGRPRRKADRHQTTYVPQEMHFVPTLTVSETCAFHAALAAPSGTGGQQRQERIQLILGEIGLLHASKTLVGGMLPGGIMLRGLSGGERRRLAIAVGLLAGPSLMFLDEPTSGLDSFAAYSVVKLLQQLAHQGGHTVLTSLHQPRASIWCMCDKVVLLGRGRLLYTGTRSGMVPWFEQLGYDYDPDLHGLPSDWVMDLINIDYSHKLEQAEGAARGGMTTVEQVHKAADLFQSFQKDPRSSIKDVGGVVEAAKGLALAPSSSSSSLAGFTRVAVTALKQSTRTTAPASSAVDLDMSRSDSSVDVMTLVDTGSASPTAGARAAAAGMSSVSSLSDGSPNSPISEDAPRDGARWIQQLRVLMWRELMATTRNPADVAGRLLVCAYVGLMVGLVGYNIGSGLEALRARLNIMYAQILVCLLLPFVYLSLYIADKQYFIADVNAGLYRPSAYYLAKQLVVLPFALVNIVLCCCIVYGLAGLTWNPTAFLMYLVFCILVYLVASQLLNTAAIITTSQDMAFVLGVAWTAANVLLCNLIVRFADMQLQWVAAFRYLTAAVYAFDGMVSAQFRNTVYPCSPQVLDNNILLLLQQLFPNTAALRGDMLPRAVQSAADGCVMDLSAVGRYFTSLPSMTVDVAVLLAYLVVLHGCSFVALKWAAGREKR